MSQAELSALFDPITFGGMTLPNRIVMSSMTRQRSPGGIPNDLNREYYELRADAGLVMSESTYVSATGVSRPGNMGLFTDEHVRGWKAITDAVHARGGRMIVQLMHSGHNSHPSLQPDGRLPVGPSAIPAKGAVRTADGYIPLGTPRALEVDEMPGLVDEYRQAALRARAAGFDGVEVHAGNGYLLDQFLRDSTNRRTDEYGGSPENRRRLLLEVLDGVLQVWGRQRVGVRISPTNPAGYDIADSDPATLFACVVEGLEQRGLGFLDVVEGATGDEPDQCPFDFGRLRARFSGIYVANNRYDGRSADAAIRSGHADMVSFGRPFIANPDLVRRLANGYPLASVDHATLRSAGRTGYLDYPPYDAESESRDAALRVPAAG